MKCNETLSKWCKNKHGASKIMDTFETYHFAEEKRKAIGEEIARLLAAGFIVEVFYPD
jgi:hypothetical protein